jgi:hypothetical protein
MAMKENSPSFAYVCVVFVTNNKILTTCVDDARVNALPVVPKSVDTLAVVEGLLKKGVVKLMS